jgi:hypothetical protein
VYTAEQQARLGVDKHGNTDCKDNSNSEDCQFFFELNFCDDNEWVQANCQKSCGICSAAPAYNNGYVPSKVPSSVSEFNIGYTPYNTGYTPNKATSNMPGYNSEYPQWGSFGSALTPTMVATGANGGYQFFGPFGAWNTPLSTMPAPAYSPPAPYVLW